PPPVWRIMVVEDDPGQREALQRWLGAHGHSVLAAASAEEGLELLGRHEVDLLLSDYGLHGALSGIDVVRGALSARPGLRCALMTDWARASVYQAEIDALRALGVPLLVKPLRPADIDALLFERALPAPEGSGPQRGKVSIVVGPSGARAQPAQALRPMFDRLRRAIRATTVLLFALEPAQRRVVIVAQAGAPPSNPGALASLIYSPVRDVAEDGHSLRIVDPARAEQRARYLRDLLPFQSCVGVPVSTELPQRFALFAFSGHEHAFGERHEERLAATAVAVAGMLEREQFLTRAADTQRLALLGQLSSALVHEMNHVLTALNFTLPNIEHLLAAATLPTRPVNQRERDDQLLQQGFADLRRGLDRLTSTARMFGRVTIHSGAGVADLGATLAETVDLVRDLADRQRVTLVAKLPPALPAPAVPSAPLQQIVLNVLINAVQQIGLIRPEQAGRVVLSAEVRAAEGSQSIQVRVEDDGPGIHRQLWERIFELGFTTRREGGSGLGLYICRSLSDALGVTVRVQESYIGWGSTFVVELPTMPGAAPLEGAAP
ncbi:MAG: response regulator, partial [Chloroflexales bacterium]|nr:response regulator [Chloroflexales bacterium]